MESQTAEPMDEDENSNVGISKWAEDIEKRADEAKDEDLREVADTTSLAEGAT